MHVAIAFVVGCGIDLLHSPVGIDLHTNHSSVSVIDIESNARDRMCVLSVKGHMPEHDVVEMDDFFYMHVTASPEGCRGTHCEDLPFPNWRCKGRNKKKDPLFCESLWQSTAVKCRRTAVKCREPRQCTAVYGSGLNVSFVTSSAELALFKWQFTEAIFYIAIEFCGVNMLYLDVS